MPTKYYRITSVVFLVFVWHYLAIFLSDPLLPTPWQILQSLQFHIYDGELVFHLGATLRRVIIAFFIAMFLGVIFGILMGAYKKIDESLDFVLIIGLNIPVIVTIMICYIWIGLNDTSAIVAVVLNKVPVIIVMIREGARAVDAKLMQIAKVYHLPPTRALFRLYLPQLYPYIMASARSSLSLIWKIVLTVELLGRSDGVGFALTMFFQHFDITSILAYSFAFIFVILLVEFCILIPLEKHTNRWRDNA